jgi:hypothetical protein
VIYWSYMAFDMVRRYTQAVSEQEARKVEVMNRPFYVAGGEINRSVIQQWPNSEIMVVDFDKDRQLRKFYDETLLDLKSRGWGSEWLPKLLMERISGGLNYDLNLVNGLIDGEARSNAGNNKRVSGEAKELIEKCPNLANEKIYVGEYLKMEIGVCRQMGLMAAACMERAIKEGRAPVWKAVEYRGLYGGADPHAWAVVERMDGLVVVIDPATGYCGPETKGFYPYSAGYENHTFGKPEV